MKDVFLYTALAFSLLSAISGKAQPSADSRWKIQQDGAFGETFDILVSRQRKTTKVSVVREGKKLMTFDWDGKNPIDVQFRPQTECRAGSSG